jgi:hypothetical protein
VGGCKFEWTVAKGTISDNEMKVTVIILTKRVLKVAIFTHWPEWWRQLQLRETKFGSGDVGPHERVSFSTAGAGSRWRIVWFECVATAAKPYPMAVNGHFDGNQVIARCAD